MIGLFFKGYNFLPIKNEEYQLWDYCYYISMMFAGYFQIGNTIYFPIGFLLFLLVLLICVFSSGRMIKEEEHVNTVYVVLFLFSGFSILYCCAAAAGRMHLGVHLAGGSRHLTLLLPALLSCYFFVQLLPKNHIRMFTLTLIIVWIILTCVPLSGFHSGIVEGIQTGKIHWINAYLKTKNIRRAERISGLSLNVDPAGGSLDQKIEYLRKKRLNFFKNRSAFPALKRK